jgi:RHS repeat-associated protein
VTDAVGSTPESWDAETGAFTYDSNGNLLTAPPPYAISAVTYDHQNLPLSLTSNGVTSTYRYDGTGQRIAKQVGTGNTEIYVLDGASSLGVVTVNGSGTLTSWFFNVLAGDRVIGRQPNVGNRRYYHSDLLGSTRAVVEGGTVVESYDPEPWGLLMPGRTLGSGTKEGFTGKERDAESGLDYFGARHYMPALARWTSVDPLAEKHPEWSPYNYVLNNPLVPMDPDGRQIRADLGDFNLYGPNGDYRVAADGRVEAKWDEMKARGQGALFAVGFLPLARMAGGTVSTVADMVTGNFSLKGTFLNFLTGGRGKGVGEAASDATRVATKLDDVAEAGAGDVKGIFHRLESPTQTPADAKAIESSGELWGYPARGSDIPSVKAYNGPLPEGARGIEFTTPVTPTTTTRGTPGSPAQWYPGTPGVKVEADKAKIPVCVTKNTQQC